MKKFMGLLVAALMVLGMALMVLGMASVACAGIDFTLEFVRDFDAEATSSEAELATEIGAVDYSLVWTRDWTPGDGDVVELDVGLTLADVLRLGFDRELTVVDPGTFTATLSIVPITLEYVRGLEAGVRGSLAATLKGSI